jgi:hypothetical protein
LQRAPHGVVTVNVTTSGAEYEPGGSAVQLNKARKKIVFDQGGSFLRKGVTLWMTTLLVVTLFQVPRSARRHCKSPMGLVPPMVVAVERIETMVVRATLPPPARSTVKTMPVSPATKPAL